MARYVRVYTQFWTDEKVVHLSEDARVLLLYLLTCPHGNMLGVFVLPPLYACADLKWTLERYERAFAELDGCGLVVRDEELQVVWLPNYLKHNPIENPNQVKAAIRVVEELPRTWLLSEVARSIKARGKHYLNVLVQSLLKRLPQQLPQLMGEQLAKQLVEQYGKPETETETETEVPLPPPPLTPPPPEEEAAEAASDQSGKHSDGDISLPEDPVAPVVRFCLESFLPTASHYQVERLAAWVEQDGMEPDLVIWAMEQALLYNHRNLAYVESILNNCKLEGIKTRAGAEERQAAFKRSRDSPRGTVAPGFAPPEVKAFINGSVAAFVARKEAMASGSGGSG